MWDFGVETYGVWLGRSRWRVGRSVHWFRQAGRQRFRAGAYSNERRYLTVETVAEKPISLALWSTYRGLKQTLKIKPLFLASLSRASRELKISSFAVPATMIDSAFPMASTWVTSD